MDNKQMAVSGVPLLGAMGKGRKEQTVIVTLPPQVKRYLTAMMNFNSATWIAVAMTFWLADDPLKLPIWGLILLSMAILCCVILIPVFINFINNVPWGQKE